MEKHLAKIAFRKPVGGFLGNESALDRALLHPFVIDSAQLREPERERQIGGPRPVGWMA